MLQMKSLLNLKNNFSKVLALVISISLFVQPAFAQSQIGVIDLVRIYQEYSLVEEANDAITLGEEGLKRVIGTAEAEMKKLDGKTTAEAEKSRDEIQASVDEKVEEIQDLKEGYNIRINRNIQDTIADLAESKKLLAVIDKSFSVFAADDITPAVLIELEKIKAKK